MGWTKGMKSPNAAGRPRRGHGLTDCLRAVGEGKTSDGKKRNELLAQKIWLEALKGEQWACQMIYNRLEGLSGRQDRARPNSANRGFLCRQTTKQFHCGSQRCTPASKES